MSSWIRNAWYVAGWDFEIDGSPLTRTICGVPVMLYRRLDRSVVAMRDACPHRMLPLKAEAVNRRICAETFVTAERHRFVWLWIGDKAKADPALIPDLWPCSAQGWVFDGGYYHVAADYRLMIDNLMDLTHETHVHAGSIGQPELMEAPIRARAEGDRAYVERWMPGVEAPPFWRGALKREGPVDRWQVCEFVPPSSVMIDVGVAPVGAGATIERHDQGVRGMVIDCMTPETETSMHYFWGMARSFDVDDTGFTARFKRQQGGVFAEDKEILEAQQRAILANPDMKPLAYSIDQGGVRARQIIKRLIAAQETAA